MEYIHSGVCRISPKNAIALYMAAEEYHMVNLIEKSLDFIQQNLSESNALYFFKDLERFKSRACASPLKIIVVDFISSNLEKILLGGSTVVLSQPQLVELLHIEHRSLSELSKFHVALIWTKAHMHNKSSSDALNSFFAPFLDCLKLTKIPIQNLVEDVRKSKAVPERLLAHACAHNELKESYRLTSSYNDDRMRMLLKKSEAAAKHKTPLVVGINPCRNSFTDVAVMEQHSQAGKGSKANKKVRKHSKNKYEMSQSSYSSRSPSTSRLTKAKKLSSSSPCLDLMF